MCAVTKQAQIFNNPNVTTPFTQINDSIQAIDSMIPAEYKEDIATYLTKFMQAVALGVVPLTRPQTEALRLLFTKKVPDAPKELNINSKISVESIIHTFLQDNQSNMQSTLLQAKSASAIEATYKVLESGV